jgi:hypothetical protein
MAAIMTVTEQRYEKDLRRGCDGMARKSKSCVRRKAERRTRETA